MTFPTMNKHMTTAVEELSNRAMTFGDQLTMIIPQEVCKLLLQVWSGTSPSSLGDQPNLGHILVR